MLNMDIEVFVGSYLGSGPILGYDKQGLALEILKGFYQKAFSRMLGHDWLMLKHQPIKTKHSAKSFLLKAI